MSINRRKVKNLLGEIPLTAEVYWHLFQRGKPITRSFSLRRTQKALPVWCAEASNARTNLPNRVDGKRVLLFSTLRYWLEHAALFSTALSGLGHQVTLAYLPYPSFNRPLARFDLRRNNAYTREVLSAANGTFQTLSVLDLPRRSPADLPGELKQAIREVSRRDTQYTLQIEEIDEEHSHSPSGKLFRLRQHRNLSAAAAIMNWIQEQDDKHRPEILLTPNGSILEMGAIYQTARYLGIPAVTYEFGEQRGRIWLAQNSEVMLQETGGLWEAHHSTTLNENQWEQIRALYGSRQKGHLWENFARLWQGQPNQGGKHVRQVLGLDNRPIILLAANVIGDSLTLGRQVFTKNMTEWLQKSVLMFADRQDIQLIVRIHPGERYLKGPSVAEVVKTVMPSVPTHIHLIEAAQPINTYDLIEIADLGLAYTTTVGLEMAMSGIPVVLGGHTHYRNKGFTYDPQTWQDYNSTVEQILSNPRDYRLSVEQVERAWRYAYMFYFEYPKPFPWHLLEFWGELETWPLSRVLSEEGQRAFGDTFAALVGTDNGLTHFDQTHVEVPAWE